MNLTYLANKSGFETFEEYAKKVIVPSLLGGLFLLLVSLGVITIFQLPWFVLPIALVFPLLGLAAVFLYPTAYNAYRRYNIRSNIYLFITYAASLVSSLEPSRSKLFEILEGKDEFGEITTTIRKIRYLATDWELGYTPVIKKIGRYSPSPMFADFLGRFGTALGFGEDLSVFLRGEQKSVMDEYETFYRKSLEYMDFAQDLYMSVIISAGFIIAAVFFVPFLLGESFKIEWLLLGSLMFIFFCDIIAYAAFKSILPTGQITHDRERKDPEHYKTKKVTYATVPLSIFLTLILLLLQVDFSIIIPIAFTPLIAVGYYGRQRENRIMSRDRQFPGLIRSLGGTMSARGGSILDSLAGIQTHDFGLLNKNLRDLYRRIKLREDRMKAWRYFTEETGSKMIHDFCSIFIDITERGGEPAPCGQLVSENFMRITDLRTLRMQTAARLRGFFYGANYILAFAAFATLQVAEMTFTKMANVMSQIPEQGAMGMSLGIKDLFYIPTEFPADFISTMMFTGFAVQMLATGLLLKVVDGGDKRSVFLEMGIIMWLLLILKVAVEFGVEQMLTV